MTTWIETPPPDDDGPFPFNLHKSYSSGEGDIETFGMGKETTHVHFYTSNKDVARDWCKAIRSKLPKTIVTYSLERPWRVIYDEEAYEPDEHTRLTSFTCFHCEQLHSCNSAWNYANVDNHCLERD